MSDLHLQVLPLLVTVAEEGAKETGVEVVKYNTEQILIELKGIGKLLGYLESYNIVSYDTAKY